MSPDAPDLITVSALLARVESRIETLATGWWITGEVAEAKVSAANHCYFTLRDEGGQIRCVLFAGVLKSLEAAGDFEIRAGDIVRCPAGVKHWHGAAPDSWFSHLAVEVPGENCRSQWCEPVSEEEYRKLK